MRGALLILSAAAATPSATSPPAALPSLAWHELSNALIMGDTSLSMMEGTKMDELRQGMENVLRDYNRLGMRYAMCAWNHEPGHYSLSQRENAASKAALQQVSEAA